MNAKRLPPPIAVALALLLASGPSAACALVTHAEFEFIDSNDDGRVSSSEHEVYARMQFDRMDADPDDDKLTTAEIMANEENFVRHIFAGANMLGPAELSTAEKIQRLDANHDGLVSQTEYANAAAAKYQKMDVNNNGELSPQEFEAGRQG